MVFLRGWSGLNTIPKEPSRGCRGTEAQPQARWVSRVVTRRQARRRLLGSFAVVAYYVLITPLIFLSLWGTALAQEHCEPSSVEWICSHQALEFINGLRCGGITVGLVCTAITFVGIKIAPSTVWRAALVLAVVSPALGTAAAVIVARS